jgi:cell fate regulator YaaT (PSP1 superfamily)
MPDSGQPKHVKIPKLMLVRYGRLGHVGWFEHDEAQVPKVQSKVLVKTERGLELGEIVGPFCYKAGHFRFSTEAVDDYYKGGGEDQSPKKSGEFVRLANKLDTNEDLHLRRDGRAEMDTARRIAKEHNVQIDIVDVEHIFGGERIIFYFVAESRVDFRELVRILAKEYQTRIEMRQIGSRDEARLMGDYETCGQECCCSRFMRILKPVNMRMAKLQKATLDPSKISGYCGRLKCCLRFEDDTYRELRDRLPKRGTRLKTPEGMGTVIDGQVLSQLVVLMMDDGRQAAIPLEEIEAAARAEQARDGRGGEQPVPRKPVVREEAKEESDAAAVDELPEDVMASVEERYEAYQNNSEEDDEPEEEERPEPPAQPGASRPQAEKGGGVKWAPVGGKGRDDGRGGGRGQNQQGNRQGGQQGGQQGRQQGGPQNGQQSSQQNGQQGGQPGQGGGGRRRRRRRGKYKGPGQPGQGGPGQGGQPGQPPSQGQQGEQRSDNGA